MRQRPAATLLCLCLANAATLFAQDPPPPPPPPMPIQPRDAAKQKPGTARLAGRVTSLDTGRPIRRAVVRASGPELREGKSVSTDAEGKWELREIPAGRFTINVTKGGYVSLSYGQQRPFEAGKQVDVIDGQVIEKLDVALPRGSAISGRVVDEFGDPVTSARVLPMRYRFTGGQRRLVNMGSADTTDDLGQFRLHGLAPGDYYVSTQPTGFTFVGNSMDRTGYGQTFFPGTLNASDATRVTLAVGQEAQNIVISLTPTRVATIAGTATTSQGKPIPAGMILLRETSSAGLSIGMPGLVRNGAWSVSGVVPGTYTLTLQHIPALEQLATTGGVGGISAAESAVEQITVTGDDIRGLALVTAPGATVRGQVRFEGAATPPTPPSGTGIQSFSTDDPTPAMFSAASMTPDWSFELRGLFGRRVLRPSGFPPGWTLKSITVEGTDITDAGMDFRSGQDVSDVEVVVTRAAAEISGTVQTAKGTGVTDYVVVLFPPESERWGWQSRFVRVGRPDQTGRFVISGLPPSSYLAVALEYLEPGEETNPDFLERLRTLGSSVRLAEGDKKTITLKMSAQ